MGEDITHIYKGTNWNGDDISYCGISIPLGQFCSNDQVGADCDLCIRKHHHQLRKREEVKLQYLEAEVDRINNWRRDNGQTAREENNDHS